MFYTEILTQKVDLHIIFTPDKDHYLINISHQNISVQKIVITRTRLPVRQDRALTKPFLGGQSECITEWFINMYSAFVCNQELWRTKSRFFTGDGQATEIEIYIFIVIENIFYQVFSLQQYYVFIKKKNMTSVMIHTYF